MSQSPTRTSRLPRILIIDDDPIIERLVLSCIGPNSFDILQVSNAQSGLQQIEDWRPDLVLLDQVLPDRAGIDVIPEIAGIDRQLPVLFITASSSSQTAIEAARRGAFDFLTKPLALNRLQHQIQQAMESRRLLHRPVVMNPATNDAMDEADVLVGRSQLMVDVYKAIGRFAATQMPALIFGESGAGKELVARAIHQHSPRSREPLLVVNCADYGPHDLEELLFLSMPQGMLERARGGTLLLKSIEAIPQGIQLKLLQHIRHAANQTSDANRQVSLLFTSQVLPESLLVQRQVRSDLYYELVATQVWVPPLRERREDIPILIEHYLSKFCRIRSLSDSSVPRISDAAMQMLVNHGWPGNVAELKSVIRRALIETQGTILATELLQRQLAIHDALHRPANASHAESSETLAPMVERLGEANYWEPFVRAAASQEDPQLYLRAIELVEQGLIKAVLNHTQGNVSHAARMLGMTRVSLRKKSKGGLRDGSEDDHLS